MIAIGSISRVSKPQTTCDNLMFIVGAYESWKPEQVEVADNPDQEELNCQ